MLNCHCRDCQQVSGGPYAPVLLFPLSAFSVVKGELRHHYTEALRGGKNKRGFCAQCGSHISDAESERQIGIHATSLDDPSVFRAQFDIFVTDAQPWIALDPEIPKFDHYPSK